MKDRKQNPNGDKSAKPEPALGRCRVALDEVSKKVKRGEFEQALALLNGIIGEYPDSPDALRERASLHEWSKNIPDAIRDLAHLIDAGLGEARDYFTRGILLINAGRHAEAVADFGEIIEYSERKQDFYFYRASRLHRSYALLKLARYREALDDGLEIGDLDCRFFIDGRVRTAAELMAAADAGLHDS